ncbi:MAG: 3-oxoacyl-ACP reductase family protein [Desulfatiglandaceae bacterium]|jgi:NAD(P)-dependent dehydrogenase (short-subunit alcohol dehydrogenase family)
MKLKDKTAIVTGASQGIGGAIALGLAEAGADIVVNYRRSSDAARNVARKIEKLGRRALVVQSDVSRREEVKQLVESALEAFNKIDILVNNAGIFIAGPIEEVTEEDWDRVMAVNLKAVFLCSQAVGKHLIARKSGGAIINVASISAHLPEINGGCYTPSKAGVIGLTKLLAIEWARYHIRVNAISPGPVMTPLQRKAYPDEKLMDARNRAVPLGRHGRPEEIAGAAVFLASDDAGYLTGEELTIDGGSKISMFHLVHQLAGSP